MALEFNLENAHVDVIEENGEPAGYLLGRPGLGWQPLCRPIFQAAVAMDAQRRHNGLALLGKIETEARAAGSICLQANCAIGVEANEFWHAAGFKPIVHLTPHTARAREIICWRKPLVNRLPLWFIQPPARSGHMARKPRSVRNSDRDQHALDFALRYVSARTVAAKAEKNPTAAA